MTPAKKLAFIDKVSGVEDAKELLVFLEDRRKAIKAELNLSSKLVVPPSIDKELLNLDYSFLIQKEEEEKVKIADCAIQMTTLDVSISRLQDSLTQFKSQLKKVPQDLLEFFSKYDNSITAYKSFNELLEKEKEYKKRIRSISDKYTFSLNSFNWELPALTKHKEDLRHNELYKQKVLLQSKGDFTCPTCSTTSYLMHDTLQHYDNLDDTPRILDDSLVRLLAVDAAIEYLSTDKHEYDTLIAECTLISQAIFAYPEFVSKYTLDIFNSYYSIFESSVTNIEQTEIKIEQLKVEKKLLGSIDFVQLNTDCSLNISRLMSQQFSVAQYLEATEIYTKAEILISQLKEELTVIQDTISEVKTISEKVKRESIPLINYHASTLLNSMTDSVLSKIEITDTYDIVVDGKSINVCSGSEMDTASLAFRLSLGHSIILGMLPLFLGDEIDAASRLERSLLMTEVLQNLSSNGYQVILITHKDTTNFENCNIIDLEVLV
jgi:tetratricopeptide (TPR) repeat protein